jgi:hypothetical protein
MAVTASMVTDAKDMARICGIELYSDELANFTIPTSAQKLSCAAWIREYATLNGDLMPDTDGQWHLDPEHKTEIWSRYKFDCTHVMKEKPISVKDFYTVWAEQCSKVKVREFKNVTGKCSICANFSEMRKKSKSLNARSELTACWLFHRATFSKERQLYHERRMEAKTNPKVWSCIGDGMQQVCE